jgi:hypothetical protein
MADSPQEVAVAVIPMAPLRGINRIHLGHLFSAGLYLLLLCSPLLWFVYVKTTGWHEPCMDVGEGNLSCELSPLNQHHRLYSSTVWGGLISLAATAGCLGIIVSFFLRQTKNEPINSETVRRRRRVVFIGFREISILAFFGAIFGILMLTLFLAGLVKGALFPEINASSWLDIYLRGESWAKAFVWCFLAGFSERLIPNLLDGLVRRGQPDDSDPDPDPKPRPNQGDGPAKV